MDHYLFFDIFTGVLCSGYGLTYLYMVNYIRTNSDAGSIYVDNIFILNFVKVYINYVRIKRNMNLSIGIIFYLHFLCLISAVILIYRLQAV
jgi:hypothetical protein